MHGFHSVSASSGKLKYLWMLREDMAKLMLRCGNCRYKFSRTHVPNLCPFCGQAAVAEDTNTSAEALLREVDDMEQMMGRRS